MAPAFWSRSWERNAEYCGLVTGTLVGLGGQALGTLELACTNSLGMKWPEWLSPGGAGNPGDSST